MSHSVGAYSKGTKRQWTLESIFLGFLGLALLFINFKYHPHVSIVEETIILVIFLGALLGVAPIPFPNLKGKRWLYPVIAGLLSAFMDSFLVLLMVAAIPLVGSTKNILKFKAYNMIAALIGGLLVYFGEVYALPHYLKYGMHSIVDGLPLLVPVLIFLGVLGYFVSKLDLEIATKKDTSLEEGIHQMEGGKKTSSENTKRTWENIIEFIVGIAIILLTHNAILALGILLVYAFLSGQGEDLLHVIKTETEMGVMLLLLTAWLIFNPVQPLLQIFQGLHAIWPSMINAVFAGALLPAGGNVWMEIMAISTGALFLPISSLVGVMLFKTMKEWWAYVKISVPLMILWFALGMSWFTFVWPAIDPVFYSFANRPEVVAASDSHEFSETEHANLPEEGESVVEEVKSH